MDKLIDSFSVNYGQIFKGRTTLFKRGEED